MSQKQTTNSHSQTTNSHSQTTNSHSQTTNSHSQTTNSHSQTTNSHWHILKGPYTRFLQVKHNLPLQAIAQARGNARGQVNVLSGPPQPADQLYKVCKLQHVIHVQSVPEGVFVTISEPRLWDTLTGEIQRILEEQ